jgi:hypothetical protein
LRGTAATCALHCATVEIDDAYPGGERASGKRDRGSPGKTPFVVAVDTTAGGRPVRLKLHWVTSCCATAISGFAKRSVYPACSAVSDRLQCFGGVARPARDSGSLP